MYDIVSYQKKPSLYVFSALAIVVSYAESKKTTKNSFVNDYYQFQTLDGAAGNCTGKGAEPRGLRWPAEIDRRLMLPA